MSRSRPVATCFRGPARWLSSRPLGRSSCTIPRRHTSMKPIQMVDLVGQYQKIKPEVDAALQRVIDSTAFINGPEVKTF